MAEQINWQIITQLVPEVTPGTSIAATHQLAGYALADGAHVDTYQTSPQGHAYITSSNRGKGWGEIKPVGDVDFNGLAYPLSSLFGAATITTAVGGTLSKQWKWTPPIINTVLGQTYTVERGQTGGRARKYAYGCFDTLKLSYTKGDVTIDGHMFSREMTEGITLTSLTPTAIVAAQPVRGTDTSLYLDSTSGGIGGTQLTRVGAMDVSFGNYYIPWYGIDSSQTSFSVLLPAKPTVDLTFRLMSDAAGMAIYNNYVLTGNTAYIRFNTVGPVSDGTAHYTLTLDMACKITGPQDFTEDSGAEVIPFTAKLAEDTAWASGQAVVATLINMISAL